MRDNQRNVDIWRLALPGFCASFVSIGLARFAYPMLNPHRIGLPLWLDEVKERNMAEQIFAK